MKAIAIALGLTAYTVYSYGYILIKGYNITLRQWVTPLHPYAGTWPPLCVPPGYIFPTTAAPGVQCKQKGATGSTSPTGSNSPAAKRAARASQQAHRPIPPGQPGSRL